MHLCPTLLLLLPAVSLAAELPASPSLPATLRVADALKIFHEHGYDLLLADAAVTSAEGDQRIASAIPNPAVSLSGATTYLGALPGSPAQYGFSLGLSDQAAIEDSLSGKRGLRMRVADLALEATRRSRADVLRNADFLLKQQLSQAALAKMELDFAIEVARSSDDTLKLNQVRYKLGAISDADLAKFEVAKLEADQAVDFAQQVLRSSLVTVAFFLGVRGPVPEFTIEDGLLHQGPPTGLQSESREQLIAEGLDHRPDLLAARLQMQRSEAGLALAERQRFPDITLSVQHSQQGPPNSPIAVTPPTLTVGLAAPIPVLYQQQGELAKAEADQRTQVVQANKLTSQVVADVETAFAAYTATSKLVERMESQLLGSARRQRDLVEVQYKKGAASLLDFLDARRTFIATNVEYMQDLASRQVAIYQLEQATGMEPNK